MASRIDNRVRCGEPGRASLEELACYQRLSTEAPERVWKGISQDDTQGRQRQSLFDSYRQKSTKANKSEITRNFLFSTLSSKATGQKTRYTEVYART